jgi:hypothetical protein
MSSIAVLLALMLVAYLFLLQRRQDERAIALARQLCQQQQVQYLDCARDGHRWVKRPRHSGFSTLYLVDFSGDGESRYQAELWLKGLRLADFVLPPFRI